jgi:hypothetical protein
MVLTTRGLIATADTLGEWWSVFIRAMHPLTDSEVESDDELVAGANDDDELVTAANGAQDDDELVAAANGSQEATRMQETDDELVAAANGLQEAMGMQEASAGARLGGVDVFVVNAGINCFRAVTAAVAAAAAAAVVAPLLLLLMCCCVVEM